MRTWVRPRLTYANVMVTVLMFVVLGGGAYATHTHKIGTNDLKNRAVKAGKVANDAVVPRTVKSDAVRPRHIRDQAISARHIEGGAIGPDELADGSVGLDQLRFTGMGATSGSATVPANGCAFRQALSSNLSPGDLVATELTTSAAGLYTPVVVARSDGSGGAVAEVVICNSTASPITAHVVTNNRLIR